VRHGYFPCLVLSAVPRILYGRTMKGTLLERVPRRGVTTWTVPVVAPVGPVALIWVAEPIVDVAGVPLKVTLVAPVRS
jgi:hypothetical protein